MALICVAVVAPTSKEMEKAAFGLDCDIIEVRLDNLADPMDQEALSKIEKPLIATCMPDWEGGSFKGEEDERIDVLTMSLSYASHISIEQRMDPKLRDELMKKAKAQGVNVILTHHDFEKTPDVPMMVATLKEQEASGADIAKIAYMPKTQADALNVLLAVESAGLSIPVIALALGEIGKFTRIMGPMLGGYLTFCAPDGGAGTAPGQYTLSEMKIVREHIW